MWSRIKKYLIYKKSLPVKAGLPLTGGRNRSIQDLQYTIIFELRIFPAFFLLKGGVVDFINHRPITKKAPPGTNQAGPL